MQLGSRLEPFGVPIVALDFPGVPDGIGAQYPGLVRAFGADRAAAIMGNVIRLAYDGSHLPSQLDALSPRFLLEAVPEDLEIKRAHYEVFRAAFPEIEIRSVTSGFPQSELGVGVAHPAFPHEINKIFEIVEPEPSDDHPVVVGARFDPDHGQRSLVVRARRPVLRPHPRRQPLPRGHQHAVLEGGQVCPPDARAEPVPGPRRHRRPRRELPHLVVPAPPGAALRRPLRSHRRFWKSTRTAAPTGIRRTTSGLW